MEIAEVLLMVGVNVAVTSGILYVIYIYVKNTMFPEIFGNYVKSEEMKTMQESSAISRVTNEANRKIGASLIENSPLKAVLQYLDEETVNYLLEHPDSLPGVIKKWMPVIEAANQVIPLVKDVLSKAGEKGKDPTKYMF